MNSEPKKRHALKLHTALFTSEAKQAFIPEMPDAYLWHI